MRLDTRFLGWGVFFIVAGGLALIVRSGYLTPDVAAQLWRLWPLVLVGFGVGVLLGRTPLAWLGGIIVAATFGLIVGGALSGGLDRIGCTGSGGGSETTVGGQLSDGVSVSIESACGEVTISSAPGAAWSLTYRSDPAPTVDQSASSLRIASPTGSFLRQSGWKLVLPTDPKLSVDVTASAGGRSVNLANAHLTRFQGTFNAGSFDVDLSGATLGALAMTLNAGSGTLRLPTGAFKGDVNVNAGSLTVCVAPDAGLRIRSGGAVSSTDFSSAGLSRGPDGEWVSPGIETAETVMHLTIDANAASVTLRRDGGCQ